MKELISKLVARCLVPKKDSAPKGMSALTFRTLPSQQADAHEGIERLCQVSDGQFKGPSEGIFKYEV